MGVGPQYLPQVPVPLSATVCTPAPPPAATRTVAALAPADVGMNTTSTVQVVLTATDVPQVLVCENCPGFAPASVMLVIGKGTTPVLVTVAVCASVATFKASFPNASGVGANV